VYIECLFIFDTIRVCLRTYLALANICTYSTYLCMIRQSQTNTSFDDDSWLI